jgi:NAD(P)-dependent dehydrogenase (short-subunit alcohol dehydrogenase family)
VEQGKHAFVTGGATGIGLAITRALWAEGWRISVASRSREKLDAGEQQLIRDLDEGIGGDGAALFVQLDVTDPASVDAAVMSTTKTFGPVHLLVNNAGGVTSASFEKTSLEAWRQALDLNLMGSVHCARAVLPAMKAAGKGRIVNIASTAGLIGYPYVTAYVAAKHAVVGFTKALALEVAKSGVTVNAVCPGFTDTAIVSDAVKRIVKASGRSAEDTLATFTGANPQGRLVTPAEVASAVLWLASDEAAAVNGVALPIAGGEVA